MEKITVKDSRMYSLVVLYDMHTDFFSKAIDGISDRYEIRDTRYGI